MEYLQLLARTVVISVLSCGLAALAQEPAAPPPAARQTTQPQAVQQPAQPPPAQPRITNADAGPDFSDGLFSFELFGLFTRTHPDLRQGKGSTNTTTSGNLDYPRKDVAAPGVVVSFPAGKGNTLRVSYFRLQGSGNTVAPAALNMFSTGYDKGDILSTKYTLQNAKVTFDYLSYPFPPQSSKFRFKVLFEAQYTNINTNIHAPQKPTTDSSGNPIVTTAQGSRWFIYPALGLGVERAISKHFRVEAKGTGFAIPHHASIWDAEGLAAYRHGKMEIIFMAKGFHFKTSVQKDQYFKATLPGAGIGLRWYP